MSQIGSYDFTVGTVVTLTGNAGGAVGPNGAGNISVLGGNNITSTGNAGANTITFAVTGTTDHALQVGNATGSLTSLAVGATGTVLIGTTGADPSFSATPTVTTVYATTFDTNVAAAGVTLSGTTLQTDGTDANININLTTKGTGALIFDGISTGYNGSQWVTAQYGLQTTDATITPIIAFAVAEGQMVTVKAYINGFRSTFADALGSEVLLTVYRPTGGNVTIVGDGVVNTTSTAAADVTTTVDIPSQEIRINVVGIVAQTWNWVASYSYFFTVTNA